MAIAIAVASRGNCLRRNVGAVIVRNKAIVSTGYNGTPLGVKNCFDGGCPRCASGAGARRDYDSCLCAHAESNAIVFAARHGNAIDGGVLYSTLRPCFGCLKEAVQAGLSKVIYLDGDEYPGAVEDAYSALRSRIDLTRLPVDERPDAAVAPAVSPVRALKALEVPIGTQVLFENDRVRIWDLLVPAGSATPWHQHFHDYFYVVVMPGSVYTEYRDGTREFQADHVLDVGFHKIDREHRLVNQGDTDYRNIVVELLHD